jgi:hypothetical protein
MANGNPQFTGQPGQVFAPKDNGSDYFWYTHPPISTLASTAPNATQFVQTDADSDFYCVALSYAASIADAALTESSNVLPLVRLLITDTGSGKSLMNAALPMYAFLGDGKRPYRLARPRVFGSNATIKFDYSSFVTAGTTYSDVQTVLHGYKIYK